VQLSTALAAIQCQIKPAADRPCALPRLMCIQGGRSCRHHGVHPCLTATSHSMLTPSILSHTHWTYR
jgi:hypothetical protein